MSLARGAVLMVAATAVQQIIDVATVMILTRSVAQHDYGTYGQCSLAVQTLLPLLVLGLPTTISSLLPRLQGDDRQGAFLCLTMGRLALFGLIGGGGLAASAGAIGALFDNPDLPGVLRLAGLTLGCEVAAAHHPHFYTISGRLGRYAVLSIAYSAVRVGLVCAIVAWAAPQDIIAWSVGGMASCSAARLAFVTIDALRWRNANPGGAHPEDGAHQWRSALPLGVAQAIGTVNRVADKNIVAGLTSPAQYAVYSAGAFEVPLIGSITGAITSVLLPRLSAQFRTDGDNSGLIEAWGRCALVSACVVAPMFFALLAFPDGLISLLFSDRYLAAVPIFLTFLALVPIRCIDFTCLLLAADRNGWITRGLAVAAALEVAGCLILLPAVGPWGAAAAYVAATASLAIFLALATAHIYRVSASRVLPWARLSRIFLICGIAALPAIILARSLDLTPTMRLFVGSGGIGICACGALWFIEKDLRRNVIASLVRTQAVNP